MEKKGDCDSKQLEIDPKAAHHGMIWGRMEAKVQSIIAENAIEGSSTEDNESSKILDVGGN